MAVSLSCSALGSLKPSPPCRPPPLGGRRRAAAPSMRPRVPLRRISARAAGGAPRRRARLVAVSRPDHLLLVQWSSIAHGPTTTIAARRAGVSGAPARLSRDTDSHEARCEVASALLRGERTRGGGSRVVFLTGLCFCANDFCFVAVVTPPPNLLPAHIAHELINTLQGGRPERSGLWFLKLLW